MKVSATILKYLRKKGSPASRREIAEALHKHPKNIHQILKWLMREGYVLRIPNPNGSGLQTKFYYKLSQTPKNLKKIDNLIEEYAPNYEQEFAS